ncbi:rhodanese domain-containing protein CG4456-like [Venturia canescens]|uniref:rhodanese domain-containing protein CG4456-like n=1 Tax=Venturia canescens TaxID=32260 RepID=UPI001C9C56AD|nr:rhodanese domain-containing protein CG4456-like [Venturia canescens]
MFSRNALQLASKSFRSSSLSSLYSTCSKTKSILNCDSFRQNERPKAETQQFFQRLSTSTGPSFETTHTMDGAGDRKVLTADYNELVEAQKKGDLIIDVREDSEINETGKLPGSIHIPMANVTNLLTSLSDEAFKSKYEKSKPTKDTKIILSCRSGMRSGKVQEEMQKLGYENVYNYKGGWLDWESKQKL